MVSAQQIVIFDDDFPPSPSRRTRSPHSHRHRRQLCQDICRFELAVNHTIDTGEEFISQLFREPFPEIFRAPFTRALP